MSKVKCENCKYLRDFICKNPDSPYGGKPRLLKRMGCYAGSNSW